MQALERQNKILEEQIKVLTHILSFIVPIGNFFQALKTVTKFAAWIIGTAGAGYALWETLKAYARNH